MRGENAPFAGGTDERHGAPCKELEQARIDTLPGTLDGVICCVRDDTVSNSAAARLQTEWVKARFMEADLGPARRRKAKSPVIRMAKPLKVVHKILI